LLDTSFLQVSTLRSTLRDVLQADVADINAANDPFSYSRVGKTRRIIQATIKATIYDGDTGPGEGDVDDLTLALDGFDTGIKLNGFPDDKTQTRTISGVPVKVG